MQTLARTPINGKVYK